MNFDLFATPSEHNILWAWVTAVLPSDTSSPWGFAMAVFSSTLTYVAVLMLGFYVVSAIISSAYSGKVLGDKFHQIWMPLRLVFGFGMLVPIGMSFSSGHWILRDLVARPAVNVVDAVWVAYVDYTAGKEVKIAPSSPGGSRLVMDILESETCVAAHNKIMRAIGRNPIGLPPVEGVRKSDKSGWWNPVYTNERQEWYYGPNCGKIAVPVLADKPGFTADREAAVAKIVESVRGSATTVAEKFRFAQPFSVEAALNGLRDGTLPQISEAVREGGAAYDAAIAAATVKEMGLDRDGALRRQKLVDAARQQGAATAGMWWMHISQRSQEVSALSGAKHERIGIRFGDDSGSVGRVIDQSLATLRNLISGEEAEIQLTANDFAAGGDASTGLLTRILSPMVRDLGQWSVAKGNNSDSTVQKMLKSDPIGDQISSGHAFMNIAETGITAAFIPIALAFSGLGIATGAAGAAIWAMAWAGPILGLLWIVGAVRAYVLPILPFIYVWVFMSLWLLAVLEAAISLVVWAFGFIRMDGEDFLAQQSKMGAMLLFQVFLMPVLGLLAFEAAFILLPLIIGGLEILWGTAFFGQTGGYLVGPSALIVGYVLITFLTLYLVAHIFGQIFQIPDRVMAWFGAPSHGFSDKSLFVATAGAAAAVLGRGMPGLPNIPKPKGKDDTSGGKGKASGGVSERKA